MTGRYGPLESMIDIAKDGGRLSCQSDITLSETIVTSERDVPAANFSLKNEKYPVAIEICRKFLKFEF